MAPIGYQRARQRPHLRQKYRRRRLTRWALLSPAVALVSTFYLAPLVLLIVMSFFNWPLLGEIRPAGLDNYARALQDEGLGDALRFTLGFTLALVPLSLLTSYGAALIVRRTAKGTGLFRTAYFLPVAIGFTAAAYMASVLLTPETGVVNQILRGLGITDGRTTWFSDTGTAFWAVVVITVWKNMGVAMILLMAGMQAIEPDLIEAAKIDGAGWWRRERSIVLPLIRSSIVLCLVLTVSGTFLTFDQFYVLTKGGPAGSTITAVMFTYSESFIRYRMGYGAAVSIVISLVIVAITVAQLAAVRSRRAAA